ncbi:MAG: hypothetical protein ABI254_14485, partial [Chthoniobacterales bacterium]
MGGNFTINSYTTATGGDASSFTFNASGNILKVAGNFTDAATNNTDYGVGLIGSTTAGGNIMFNGGAATLKQVSIGRTGLTTNFSVGDAATAAGDIQLLKNLTTTGTLSVLGTSTLDVVNHTMLAAATTFSSGATLDLTFGSTNGLVSASNLTLNSFNLVLANSGLWAGTNLTLFTYTGTLTGTPSLASFNAPGGFTYGSLINDTGTKTIYLSVGPVPEPSSVALICLSGIGLLAW